MATELLAKEPLYVNTIRSRIFIKGRADAGRKHNQRDSLENVTKI